MLHIEVEICRKLMHTDEMQELTKIHKDEVKIGQDACTLSFFPLLYECYKRQREVLSGSLSKVFDSWRDSYSFDKEARHYFPLHYTYNDSVSFFAQQDILVNKFVAHDS